MIQSNELVKGLVNDLCPYSNQLISVNTQHLNEPQCSLHTVVLKRLHKVDNINDIIERALDGDGIEYNVIPYMDIDGTEYLIIQIVELP